MPAKKLTVKRYEVVTGEGIVEVECKYLYKSEEGYILCRKKIKKGGDSPERAGACCPKFLSLRECECKHSEKLTAIRVFISPEDYLEEVRKREAWRQMCHPKCPKCNRPLFNGPRMSVYYYCESCGLAYPVCEFDGGDRKCGQRVPANYVDCEHHVNGTCPRKKKGCGCPYESIAERWKKCKDWPMH